MAMVRFAVSVLLLAAWASALNSLSSLTSGTQEVPSTPEQSEPTAVQPLVLVVQPADHAQAAQLMQSLQVFAEQPPLQTPAGQVTVPQVTAELPQVTGGQVNLPVLQQQVEPPQQVTQQVVRSLLMPPAIPEQLLQQPQEQLPTQLPTQPTADELERQLEQKQQLQLEQLETRQKLEQLQLEQQILQTQEQQQGTTPVSSEPAVQLPPVPAAQVPDGPQTAMQVSLPSAEAAGLAAVPAVAPAVMPTADTPAQAETSVAATAGQADRAMKVPEVRLHGSVWNLVQTLSYAMVVKALCMAGNVLVQLSPFPQVKRWEARNDTGEADAAPYVAICFGGWQWCFYGFFAFIETRRSGFLILVHSNCLGALLGTYYIFTFYKHCQCSSSKDALQKYLSGVAALVMLQFCGLLTLPAERALFLSGLISSFCSFVGALSMLVTVPTTIRTKDSRSIPGMLVAANFGSAIVWCLCGYMLGDMLVMGPNIVATISNATCLYLKLAYPSMEGHQSPKAIDDIPLHISSAIKLRRSKGEDLATKMVEKMNEKTPLREMLHGRAMETSKFSTFTGEGCPRPMPCADGTGGTF